MVCGWGVTYCLIRVDDVAGIGQDEGVLRGVGSRKFILCRVGSGGMRQGWGGLGWAFDFWDVGSG